MANEVTGKTLKYFQNGIEQPVKNVSFDRNFNMLDSTTTTTSGSGTESVAGRAKSTIKVDTELHDVLGAEISNGTLTAKNKYLVTLGTVDGHELGTIFESDGTEECTSENKVKPLGAKITGKTCSVSIGGNTFAVTNAVYDVKYNELDATTSVTAAPNTESVAGRHKITSKFDAIMYRATADLITNVSPVSQAVVLTLASGITVTGNAVLNQMSISDEVNGIVKVTYSAEWQGTPAEVGIGSITIGTAQSFKIIYETGSSTNKEVSGTVLMLGKSVTVDASNDASISYDGVINGAITPAVYS